jgi:hypothetical protein
VAILAIGVVLLLRPTILIEVMLQNFGLAIVVVVVFWLLGKVGLGSLLPSMVSRAASSSSSREVEIVTFRLNVEGEGERSVRFLGPADAINLGDELRVIGGWPRGILQPLVIVNLTDSTRMFRQGLFRSVLFLVLVLIFVVAAAQS